MMLQHVPNPFICNPSPPPTFREVLRKRFARLNFKIVDLVLSNGGSLEEEVEENWQFVQQRHEQRLVQQFKTTVADICMDDAVVFIHVSGIQFPYKVS